MNSVSEMSVETKRTLVFIFKSYVAHACFYGDFPKVEGRIETEQDKYPYVAVNVSSDSCYSPERLLPGTIVKVVDGRLEFSMNLENMYSKIKDTLNKAGIPLPK